MTKPRAAIELTDDQMRTFIDSHPDRERERAAVRRLLLVELRDAGCSWRQLAELYCVSTNTIRYWLRQPTSAKAPGYPRGRREG